MSRIRIALVGHPNCGKSTLFNGLTGGRSKTANYAGVTVERRVGPFTTPEGATVVLVDLPGIYGFASRSLDETIAVDAILGSAPNEPPLNGLIVLVDACDLRSQLQFVLQVRALGRPMIVALNMIDLAERDGVQIDVNQLARALELPVVPTRATRSAGRAGLLAELDEALKSRRWDGPTSSSNPPEAARKYQREAREIANRVIISEPVANQVTRLIDCVVLHRIAGPQILAGVLFLMFQAVFSWAVAPMDAIDAGVSALRLFAESALPTGWTRDLLVDGVIAGVGSVIIFLPQIVILFAFILILEASGYMARAAFIMDELMRRVGLNGRAFIPLLSSFACAIPGMMAARTIDNERDRLTAILIAPLMTCSARLPVYTLIIAAFIPPLNLGPFGLQGAVLFALYVVGIVMAALIAVMLRKTLTRGPRQTLLMELPTYKAPDLWDFAVNLTARGWAFLRRAGTVIFIVSIALWGLSTFPASSEGIRSSFAGMLGSVIEPILRPIGFNLEIAIALVPGMAAREVVVGALGTVYATQGATDAGLGEVLRSAWPLPTALAFLAWFAFAPQCLSSLAVARRETNSWRWTAFLIGYLFALAYGVAGLTYWIATWAGL